MIRRFMMIVALFSGIHLVCYDKIIFKNLHSRYIRNFSKTNTTIIEDRALQALEKISKISPTMKIESVLTNPAIKDLFSFEVEREEANDELYYNILGARYLILLYLYDQMFQRYIFSIESFLNSLLEAQKYWIYEDFCMRQSWRNKNIFYNVYSSQYHALTKKKITFLQDIEQQVAYMLGICLYGITRIDKVNMEEQVAENLTQFVELFYQAYNAPIIDKENQKNPVRLYLDLIWINGNLEQHMQKAKLLLEENSKPPFFAEHTVGFSCLAAATVAAALMYKKYENDIPSWWEGIKSMGSMFKRDYLINPWHKLVDNLCYHKATKMSEISLKNKINKIPLIDQEPIRHIPLIEEKKIGQIPRFKLESNIGHIPPFALQSNIGKVPELQGKLPIEEGTNPIGIRTPEVLGFSVPLIQGSAGLDNLVNDGKKTINSGVDFVNSTSKDVLNPAIETVNSGINAVGTYVDTTGKQTINPTIDTINSSVNAVGKYVDAVGQDVLNPAIDKINSVVDVTNETIENAVNPAINKVNSGVVVVNQTIDTVNSIIDGIDAGVDSLNDAREKVINPMVEKMELTLYMAMIGVGLFAGYFVVAGGHKVYKHYIKHENWYAPMRYIVRSVDQLLNKITRADDKPDFAEDGKLYMLVQHLKEYTSCLQGEELFLMNNDISELLSFDLNYHQKRGVVQRMYKTYEFLK